MKFFSRIRPTASLLLMLTTVLLLAQTALFGQATGNVTGVVADTTGAAIPKAAVVLTNLGTGSKRTATSNDDGAFAFAGVTPDLNYRLDVSAPNFESWQSQPFAVQAGAQLSYNDIHMKVGAAAAAITVEAQVDSSLAALDTGERSDVISAEELNTLTIVGRDATELVRMLPGYALSTGDQGLFNRPGYNTAVVGLSGPTGAFSANGAGVTGIAVVTDGVSLTDIATNSGSVQQINIEMVQEVKATSSSYGATLAKGPAVISADSKTGGSSFHGEGYIAARDTDLNSNDWYDNHLRQSRPAGRYLYPGVQFGGPLILPFTSFNHNHDKLFFFAGFEYYNQSFEANQQALTAWVPTMAERQGDFSPTSLDAQLCGARPDGNQNPNAIQPMCNANSYVPPLGTVDTNYSAVPYANPNGVALLNWFPLPNADPFTNQFGYNYIEQLTQQQNGGQFKATLSYDINEKNKLFFVYGLQREIDQDPVDLNTFPTSSMPYPGNVTTGDVSSVLSARYMRFFGSSVTNEFDAAMSFVSLPGKMGTPLAIQRFNMNAYNGGNGNFDILGMYKNTGDYSVPAIADGAGNGYPNLLMPGGFYNNRIRTKKVDPILEDNLSWEKGNHFFQFGGYWETGTYNGNAIAGSTGTASGSGAPGTGAYPQGEFSFNANSNFFQYGPAYTAAQFVACGNPNPQGTLRNSGSNYVGSCFNPNALIYEGYADQYQQSNFTPTVDMRYMTVSGYAQDTWKIHNLSLILGARIEHLGGWTDRHNNGMATFSPSLYSTQCGGFLRNCNSASAPGITWHSQDAAIANGVNSPQSVYFTPRIGASWDIFGKRNTVLRGGWGMYRNEEQFNPYALAAATAQGYQTSYVTGALSFNYIDSQTPVNPADFTAYTLSSKDTKRPIYNEYNVGIDQSLPWRSHLSASYVGSHNVNLGSYSTGNTYNSASDLNIICGIESGTLCDQERPNQNPNMLSSITPDNLFGVSTLPLCGYDNGALCQQNSVTSGISSFSTAETDFYRPYPFYQHVYQLSHNFYSNYSSFQVEWNKAAGIVSFGANYSFAKNLATASSWSNIIADPLNLRNDYNAVPYDRSQVFNVHYLINFGTRYKGGFWALREAANNWQVSGISSVESGFPLASEQGENFGFGSGSVLPVQVEYSEQTTASLQSTCRSTYNIQPDKNGNTYCIQSMSPAVWLGSTDIQLMPTVVGNVRGGPKAHQYVNPLGFGVPLPETNGWYRIPYIHSPYYMDHDITVLKNFTMGEGKNLQVRMAGFNVFNHPLVSFNNQDTNNLNLGGLVEASAGKALTTNVLEYPTFGIADIKVGSRLVELGAKYTF
jgi:Carboxypeptidase regulatory-like domain